MQQYLGQTGGQRQATVSAVIEAMKRNEALEQLGGPVAEMVRGSLDEFLKQHPTPMSKALRVRHAPPYSADEVIDTGQAVGRNVVEFRNALREFVRIESNPYF